MPQKIIDFSALSKIIRSEPFYVHFWECTPRDYLSFLRNPQGELAKMGIKIPASCRIETTIENHDWLGKHGHGLTKDDGTIVCNIGGENVARSVYRIISYGHKYSAIGKFRKKLLHSPAEEHANPRA